MAYARLMVSPPAPAGSAVSELVAIMDRLLAPDGCPWDREQTLDTLAPYLLEETYEVLEAIDTRDPDAHREELGDLLLQIVFQAAIRAREGAFDIDDVSRGIVDKMVRRHPHVFGDANADDANQVLEQWTEIKAREKGRRRALEGIPRALPALARAEKLSTRAARVGFDWPDADGCAAKVEEELEEIAEARASGSHDRIESEIGDLLFAVVSLARKLDVDAETALRRASNKFERRFEFVEDQLEARGSSPSQSTLEEMDELWNRSKIELDDEH
jgi:MazG family protein